jgi:hypothetical protein
MWWQQRIVGLRINRRQVRRLNAKKEKTGEGHDVAGCYEESLGSHHWQGIYKCMGVQDLPHQVGQGGRQGVFVDNVSQVPAVGYRFFKKT